MTNGGRFRPKWSFLTNKGRQKLLVVGGRFLVVLGNFRGRLWSFLGLWSRPLLYPAFLVYLEVFFVKIALAFVKNFGRLLPALNYVLE